MGVMHTGGNMWNLSKQYKKHILSHFSDMLVSGGLFAACILSFKHADMFWWAGLGFAASFILLLATLWTFFLNIAEAEDAVRTYFPIMWGRFNNLIYTLIGLVYLIPMTQLFFVIGLISNE